MSKFLFPLATVALIAISALTALAAEPETNIPEKPVLSEKINVPEAAPTLPETAATPALPISNSQNVKIGTIDMAKIASDSSSGKAAYTEVKAKMERFQKQIKSKESQLKKQKADLEAQMPSLAPIQRAAKAKEFQKKLEGFQQYIQNAEKEVRNKEAELLKKLFESVAKSAADFGQENGFAAIIINKELLYAGSSVKLEDITTEVIKLIDGNTKK
jgi:outer membrane protein